MPVRQEVNECIGSHMVCLPSWSGIPRNVVRRAGGIPAMNATGACAGILSGGEGEFMRDDYVRPGIRLIIPSLIRYSPMSVMFNSMKPWRKRLMLVLPYVRSR